MANVNPRQAIIAIIIAIVGTIISYVGGYIYENLTIAIIGAIIAMVGVFFILREIIRIFMPPVEEK